jgi:catalase
MFGHLEKINGVLASQVGKAIGETIGSAPKINPTSKGTSDLLDELQILADATTPTTASGGILKAKGLSMEVDQPKLAKGRKVAILAASGVSRKDIQTLQTDLKKEKRSERNHCTVHRRNPLRQGDRHGDENLRQ